jgi:hypothetical protein
MERQEKKLQLHLIYGDLGGAKKMGNDGKKRLTKEEMEEKFGDVEFTFDHCCGFSVAFRLEDDELYGFVGFELDGNDGVSFERIEPLSTLLLHDRLYISIDEYYYED